jgi:hypothetical protein
VKPYLYSLRNRPSNNIKCTDIDRYGAPLYGASSLTNVHEEKCQMEQRTVVCLLSLKGLKAKEIEMEPTSVYGDEAVRISVLLKRPTRFLEGRTDFGDRPRSGRPVNSDLTQATAELIRDRPFRSWKRLCKYLRVAAGNVAELLARHSGPKSIIFDAFQTSSP